MFKQLGTGITELALLAGIALAVFALGGVYQVGMM